MTREERVSYYKFGFREGYKAACRAVRADLKKIIEEDCEANLNTVVDVKIHERTLEEAARRTYEEDS